MRREDGPSKGAQPVPATKRMAAMRERRRKAGMTPMEVWAHPDDHQAIRDIAALLAKARSSAANAALRPRAEGESSLEGTVRGSE